MRRLCCLLASLALALVSFADDPPCDPMERVPSVGLRAFGRGVGDPASPFTIEAGKPIIFDVHPEIFVYPMPPTAVRYKPRPCDVATWDFGDGSPVLEVSATARVEHVFSPGAWRVEMYTSNNVGRSESVWATVYASATGSSWGGARVPLRGVGFSGDCHVWFGHLPAARVEDAEGGLIAIAPSHAEGTVDIHVECRGTRVTLTRAFTYSRPAK